jgi:transposase
MFSPSKKRSAESLLEEAYDLIERQSAQIAQLESQVLALETQVAHLSKNSSNSSKPPSSDIVNPKKKGSKGKRKRGGQKGRQGVNRNPFSSELVDEVKALPLGNCPDCQCALEVDEEREPIIQQVAELLEKPIKVTEYHRAACQCPCCSDTYYAPLPEGAIEKQLFGPRLQSLVGYMKGTLGVSYSELQQFCSDVVGVTVSTGFLANVVKRVSLALKAPYEELEAQVSEQDSLNIDESAWKNEGERYWVWIFCNSFMAYFTISKSRGSQVLYQVLGEIFEGVIISDFFSAYVKYATAKQQFCLAHLIRDIKFLTTLPDQQSKEFGEQILKYFKKLFQLWHQRANSPPELFPQRVKRLQRKLYMYLHKVHLPEGKALTLKKRLIKHWDCLFTFVHQQQCEPTNNLAEQNLRHTIRIRRQTQGTKSTWGREWIARSMTVLETCKKQNRNVWDFFNQAVNAQYFKQLAPSLIN